ncbi:NADPH-dependent assimilatory sulfite reductase hemoprotein subunit [Taibaiella koreensis]|uniref:NADPH-dependent assimilatory sulfite reductase hemoprotein subunit n=1 Tax=Taibaiella koreensis TaxID=1268548 RepID=UPI000E59FCC8|nr:NADPH-dependent assimilatory sulfite reductase hemoprotein subunit [Taibaiella koreensis]
MSTKLSSTERIKTDSKGLRGTLKESLLDEHTGALREDDQVLIKFHGMYQQDNRDRREERAAKKLDRLYSYMIRLRLPGGFLTPEQWIAVHEIAGQHTTGVIKITTRQTIQLHGILKAKIKPTIKAFNEAILDSIAACGDVNRNVVAAAYPSQSAVHRTVHQLADKISAYLKPKTSAYYEIWLDEEKIIEKEETDELYEDRYLPRKFKVAIAVPPNNDVDVYTNDVGLIAIVEAGEIKGYNIAIGGGMGSTHGNSATYPRLATPIGFVDNEEKALKAVYEIATIQRDYGNRSDRKLSRLKYTVDQYGLDFFCDELERRMGFALETTKEVIFTTRADEYGWQQTENGTWTYTLFTENGRLLDEGDVQLKTAIYEVAQTGKANIRFTCHQNLSLCDIALPDKPVIEALLKQYGAIAHTEQASVVRKQAMACVAFNTCPLALAEAQRYMPALISSIEQLLHQYALDDEEIIMRMTGCPNGCARPYAAEIGFVGTAYGRYNVYLGADRAGTRLNKLYRESQDEAAILALLDNLFKQYSEQRLPGEAFGDFSLRAAWV